MLTAFSMPERYMSSDDGDVASWKPYIKGNVFWANHQTFLVN